VKVSAASLRSSRRVDQRILMYGGACERTVPSAVLYSSSPGALPSSGNRFGSYRAGQWQIVRTRIEIRELVQNAIHREVSPGRTGHNE
jgi:hypothetical protein